MPAVSKKQERFMQAVANNPKFAKQVGVPQSVGKEFTKAGGGKVDSKMKMKGPQVDEEFRKPRGTETSDEKKRRMAEEMKRQQEMRGKTGANAPMEPTDEDMMGMKKGGMMKGYKAGGMPMVEKDGKKVPAFAADGKGKMMGGGAVGMYGEGNTEKQMKNKMKKGGKVHSDKAKDMPMMKKTAKKAVKEHEAKMHKGTKKMASGGKVRGAGCAQRGVRAAKMR